MLFVCLRSSSHDQLVYHFTVTSATKRGLRKHLMQHDYTVIVSINNFYERMNCVKNIQWLYLIIYRVFKLDLPPKKRLWGHQKFTFKSEKWYLYIHEMRNFDLIKNCFIFSTLLASTTSERKIANSFTGGGRGGPMVMPRPHPPDSK